MPVYTHKCLNSHTRDVYLSINDRNTDTQQCLECGHTMGPIINGTQALLYFEEGRGRLIHNLADKPVLVTSHAEHKRLMKKHGVEPAGNKRGTKGAWI